MVVVEGFELGFEDTEPSFYAVPHTEGFMPIWASCLYSNPSLLKASGYHGPLSTRNIGLF